MSVINQKLLSKFLTFRILNEFGFNPIHYKLSMGLISDVKTTWFRLVFYKRLKN